MIPSGTFIRVVSGFYFDGKAVVNRFYSGMPSIAVPGQRGTIIPLEVVPAADGSGTYVLVVSVQDASIAVGSTYNLDPPVLTDGEATGFQSDINGNLKVDIARPLPAGTSTIGAINQGAPGSSAWKVDPSGVTSPVTVASLPLPANAAKETGGNLATLATAQGNAGSGISEPTGGSGILGWLSGIYNKLSGSIVVTGTFWQATQPVSAASLPLPTGAATSAGQSTIISDLVTINTTLGSPFQDGGALGASTNTIGGVLSAPTSSSSFAITPGSSSELEASHVLKSSAGNLYSVYVVTSSVGGYLMTFNATDIPADGPVSPVECVPVLANSIVSLSIDGSPPDNYSIGIVAVFSTTGPFTKTASATAFFKWSVQ